MIAAKRDIPDLRTERINRGLSIRAFARRIGVHPRVIQNAEEGGIPQPRHAKLIADFLGYEVSDVWSPTSFGRTRR